MHLDRYRKTTIGAPPASSAFVCVARVRTPWLVKQKVAPHASLHAKKARLKRPSHSSGCPVKQAVTDKTSTLLRYPPPRLKDRQLSHSAKNHYRSCLYCAHSNQRHLDQPAPSAQKVSPPPLLPPPPTRHTVDTNQAGTQREKILLVILPSRSSKRRLVCFAALPIAAGANGYEGGSLTRYTQAEKKKSER